MTEEKGKLYFKALSRMWELLPAGVELNLVLLERAWSERTGESRGDIIGCRSV